MKKLTIKPNKTINFALKTMSKSGVKCLIVVDQKSTLLGTLSDGDLRRSILKGLELKKTIENIYNKNPAIFYEEEYSLKMAEEIFLRHRFDFIPVVNKNLKLKKIIYWEEIFTNGEKKRSEKLNIPAVIMAGGKGTRLEPFTKVLPKPLIPIHNKPVIDHIIEKFTDVGITEFHLTLNYKGRILKAYFDELVPDFKMHYITEKIPLGTAGSLKYLKNKIKSPFFVTNCDIIIDADYIDLYNFHDNKNNDITLVASAKEYIIPYGACELDSKGNLETIKEKPAYELLINTGLYVLHPKVIDLIPRNKFYHITDLIKDAKKENLKVGIYPISDDKWIDIGQWSEYRKVVEQL